jgi:hypothetical protein
LNANIAGFGIHDNHHQFSLHLNLAEECMNKFERDKLTVVAGVEQVRIPLLSPFVFHMRESYL